MVFYFPQGHIEQIDAKMGREGDLQLPIGNLPFKILCKVVNVKLKVEHDTDGVFAQVDLLPQPEGQCATSNVETGQTSNSREHVISFSKTLTRSDTGPHGGFSVPRQPAESCLPQLDMTRTPPAQELVAKDLYGKEWTFCHTSRGQSKRHLLTTGWSKFVSSKKLDVGDAFIFLRGENGECRVGVRRAMKPQDIASPSVISTQSMHLGLIASASNAMATGSLFTVYYWPRTNISKFIVPYDQYVESMKITYSVGMRFMMMVEGEDGQEQRCPGTIIGIDDVEPRSWPNSPWKRIKVEWGDRVRADRVICTLAERVSPWEVVVDPSLSHLPASTSNPKRQCVGGLLASAVGSSSRHNDGSSALPAVVASPGTLTMEASSSKLPMTRDNTNGIQNLGIQLSTEPVGRHESQPFKLFGVNIVKVPTSDDIHQGPDPPRTGSHLNPRVLDA